MSESMDAADFVAMQKPSANKYRAKKVEEDGFTFASQAEHRRYCQLRLLERAGKIAFLTVHPPFELVVNGHKIKRYKADFSYQECPNGALVVEDVKSSPTAKRRDYVITKKLVKALYGIEIVEVKA